MPRVSIITPVYNGSQYIADTIKSVLAQTFHDFEYIIIDDASSDNSFEVISSFTDTRITVLRNETNCYLVEARNRAIAEATGDFIALIDHDDLWTPDRLAVQVKFLDQNPDFGLVGGWSLLIDENGNPAATRRNYRYNAEECKMSLLIRNIWGNGTLLFRRSLMDQPPYDHEYQLCEDYNLIRKMSIKAKISILKKVVFKYRLHLNNTSALRQQQMVLHGLKLKRTMLASINCHISEAELAVFNNIEYLITSPSFELLHETEQCLQKLLDAVKCTNFVSHSSACAIIGEEWLLFCHASSNLGPEIWNRYLASSLSTIARPKYKTKLSLYLKSRIKRVRS